MASWCLAGGARTLLDPAVGTGVLLRAALALRPSLAVSGYDLDAEVLRACAAALPASAELRHADVLLDPPGRRFDALISNPPYLGYKQLPYDGAIFERFERLCHIPINRQSNLYVLFVLQIAQLLAPGGRAAVLIPSDWLNGNFGVPLKAYLLREALLDGLVVFDQRGLVFDDTLATSCLLLLRAGRERDAPIRLVAVDAGTAFGELEPAVSAERAVEESPTLAPQDPGAALATVQRDGQLAGMAAESVELEAFIARYGRLRWLAPAELDPAQKWLPLLPQASTPGLAGYPASAGPGLIPLEQIASVRRGVATGANDFFTLTSSQSTALELPPSALRRCLTRATQAPLYDLIEADLQQLAAAGARLLLLDPPSGELDSALLRYIRQGEALGVQRCYLPAHRRPWYRMERHAPPPILASTFGRGGMRFVLNRPLISHLTAFHGITLAPELRTPEWLYERALMSYLCAPLAQPALQLQRRAYGGGLLKWEPADLARSHVPDLRLLSHATLRELAEAFDQLCLARRAGRHAPLLDELDTRWRELAGELGRG